MKKTLQTSLSDRELMELLRILKDEDGQGRLPPSAWQKLGQITNGRVDVQIHEEGITLNPAIHRLRRIYLEITNRCNLNCRTCIRNGWDKNEGGFMTLPLFRKLLQQAASLEGPSEFFFGGYGEPLLHPYLLTMIQETKAEGFETSLITNGMLLTPDMSEALINLGLDTLWVSIDGANPESYADIRLGAALPQVVNNLENLQNLRKDKFGDSRWAGNPMLGISFVAMRRNIEDLPEVLKTGKRLGASRFFVTHLLPHQKEGQRQILYGNLLNHDIDQPCADDRPRLELPRMDTKLAPSEILSYYQDGPYRTYVGKRDLTPELNQCPFLSRQAVAVRWDGELSPCLPLMYTHSYFLDDREHTSHAYHIGNLGDHSLASLWKDEDYSAFREKAAHFSFSPCVSCNTCEMANDNKEDCLGNDHPACGTCLWAQGIISCP